jgi:hypothetical protein
VQTKLSKVQAAMRAGDWPRAFSIASKFARLGSQRAAILRAQAARLSPGLYRQLGRDPALISISRVLCILCVIPDDLGNVGAGASEQLTRLMFAEFLKHFIKTN